MANDLIHDRGRGPEIAGTRITIYNLLPYFLDPTATESYVGQVCGLTAEQIAAARAYVLNNADTVLAEHLKIEARIARGNPPEVIERAKQTRINFLQCKEWLAQRERADSPENEDDAPKRNGHFPTFREWLVARESETVS